MNQQFLGSNSSRYPWKVFSRIQTLLIGFAFALTVLMQVEASPCETHAQMIIDHVLALRCEILEQMDPKDKDGAVFLAFWDFDGTLLQGDCSEGYTINGEVVFPGLAQVCIENGLSTTYPANGGFETFWKDYRWLDEHVGHWLAYPYIPQMLQGAKLQEVRSISNHHFATTLAAHYFATSVAILKTLESNGFTNYILSASADVFVDAASDTLGLPMERFHGIEIATDEEGRLTHDIVLPMTWAKGKVTKLQQIVSSCQQQNPGRPVYVLCGFGNSYSTDGPFLECIAKGTLPTGKRPLSVMINGGTAPQHQAGLFMEVKQSEETDLRIR